MNEGLANREFGIRCSGPCRDRRTPVTVPGRSLRSPVSRSCLRGQMSTVRFYPRFSVGRCPRSAFSPQNVISSACADCPQCLARGHMQVLPRHVNHDPGEPRHLWSGWGHNVPPHEARWATRRICLSTTSSRSGASVIMPSTPAASSLTMSFGSLTV